MIKKIIAACSAALLAGCYSGKTVNYYTFTPLKLNSSVQSTAERKTVLLQRIEFPGYLKTKNIALRISENKLQFSDTNNWALPFDRQVSNYVAELLSAGNKNLIMLESVRYAKADKKVKIKILNFEKNKATGRVQLTARWFILNGADNKLVKEGVFDQSLEPKSDSFESSAEAHSELVKKLVDSISTQI